MKQQQRMIHIICLFLIILTGCSAPKSETGNPVISTVTPTYTNTSTLTTTPTILPTITSTITPKPTFTATPIPWESYVFTEKIRIGGVGKLWMPIPREWDGIGMSNVEIIDISPPPDEIYDDEQGNRIAFWSIYNRNDLNIIITFSAQLAPISYHIDPNNLQEYDTSSFEYQRYTQPSEWVQSDDEEIVQLARDIVGSVENPYYQAQMIHSWVAQNIRPGDVADAKESLQRGEAGCGGHSWLFVALLRSLGVPARGIGGITPTGNKFQSGEYGWRTEGFGIHVWSEFFLQEVGWIQVDAGDTNMFGELNQQHIVLFRGEDIELGNDYPLNTVPWFHMPQVDFLGNNSTPRSQTTGDNDIILIVEKP